MLKRVLSRAPLPRSASAYSVSKVPAAKAKVLKTAGVSVTFTHPKQITQKQSDDEHSSIPIGFRAKSGEVDLVRSADRRQTGPQLLAGLGKHQSVRDYRLAVTNAVRKAVAMGASILTIHPPSTDVLTVSDVFHPQRPLMRQEVVEKTVTFGVTAAYSYNRLKTAAGTEAATAPARGDQACAVAKSSRSKASKGSSSVPVIDLLIASNDLHAIRTGEVIGHCVNDARNLGNLREDEGVPAFYAEWTRKFVVPEGVKVRKILKGRQILDAGLNLLHNVGKGSIHEPYVVVLEYIGNKRSAHSTALVGKGVTFDCGGLNIKPYGSMETMHTDMMGAATVLATIKAVAQLKLPVNVVAAVGLVENAIGPESYFPSSILTSLKGPTVEILNTDAEGRLVLADVLTYVQNHAPLEKSPSTIIDLATLTGAILVGLGTRRAGLFSNSAHLSEKLMATGTRSGEELWPMPIGEEHMEAMRGGLADLRNVATGRSGGSCTAAAFLSNFIEGGKEWAHLDIAGTADVGDKCKGFYPAGVSGYGVQLLLDYLRRR